MIGGRAASGLVGLGIWMVFAGTGAPAAPARAFWAILGDWRALAERVGSVWKGLGVLALQHFERMGRVRRSPAMVGFVRDRSRTAGQGIDDAF